MLGVAFARLWANYVGAWGVGSADATLWQRELGFQLDILDVTGRETGPYSVIDLIHVCGESSYHGTLACHHIIVPWRVIIPWYRGESSSAMIRVVDDDVCGTTRIHQSPWQCVWKIDVWCGR